MWIQDVIVGSHRTAKAKSVIFLFMCGGVSHIDTFDPKDNKHAGKFIDAIGFGDNLAEMKRPVIPCLGTFTAHGKSGIPVSDWFPHVGGVIDEIAVVRSMWCHEENHFPAVIETSTGHRGRQFDHPTFGSWISFALGSANKNLPTFVNLGRPSSPMQLTGGYLGASVAATPFQAGETPIQNLYPTKSLCRACWHPLQTIVWRWLLFSRAMPALVSCTPMNTRFGWNVVDGRRRDSAAERIAERRG